MPSSVIVAARCPLPLEQRSLLAAAIARAVHVTRAFDWLYRSADRARSELVAALASDEVLDRFNDIAYAGSRSYRPDASSFRAYLFPWEEEAIQRFFPKPPAHVLVGGAGGGREALALVERGYRVTAFEPSAGLVDALAARAQHLRGPRRLPRSIRRPPASRRRSGSGRQRAERAPRDRRRLRRLGELLAPAHPRASGGGARVVRPGHARADRRQLSRPLRRRAGAGLISRTASARASSPSGTQARPTSSPSTSASTTARARRRSRTSPRPPASRSSTGASIRATPTGLTSCFGVRRADETEPVPRPRWFRARRLG